jgi:spermidine synthase
MADIQKKNWARHWPLMAATACGVLAGAIVVAWSRLLEAWLGRTLFTQAAIGLVTALALAAGVTWGRRRPEDSGNRRVAAWALLVAGWWGLAWLPLLPWLARRWMLFLIPPQRTFGLFLVIMAGIVVLALAVPLTAAGLAFGRGARHPRRWLGFALGVFCAAWALKTFVVPAYGVEFLFRGVALWAGLLASVCMWRVAANGSGRAFAVLPSVIALTLATVLSCPDAALLTQGLFGRWAGRGDGFMDGKVVHLATGRTSEIGLYENADFGRVLTRDGMLIASEKRFQASRILAAHVPFLLHAEARRVAIIGPEAGVALASVQLHELAQIDCFVPEPEEAAWAMEVMSAATNNCRTARIIVPKVNVQRGDAPSLWSRHAYDLVIVAGGAGWWADGGDEFGSFFLRRCHRALDEDGLLALQLDTRGWQADDFRRALRDFHRVFPQMQVWCTGAEKWLLIGGEKPIKAPVDRMLEQLNNELVFRDFVRAGAKSLPDALAGFVCDTAGAEKWIGTTGGLSRWRLAWHTVGGCFGTTLPLVVLASAETNCSWKMDWLLPGRMDPDVYVALLDRTGNRRAMRAKAVGVVLSTTDVGSVPEGLSDDALMRELMDRLDIGARRLLAAPNFTGATRCYEEMLRLAPESALAHYGLAMSMCDAGQVESALVHFTNAVRLAPDVTEYRYELGRTALQIGQLEEAIRQLRMVLAREPAHVEAMYRLSCALAATKNATHEARQEAVQLAEKACLLSHGSRPKYLWSLADRYIEAGRLRDGVDFKHKLKERGIQP